MGTTKTHIFTQDQNDLAAMAKALAHPARIAILQYLAGLNTCVCGDIVDEIGLAQSTISQHLKALKTAGLIHGEINGTSVCYCINKTRIAFLNDHVASFLGELSSKNSCC